MEDSSQTVLTNSQDFGGSGSQTTRTDITFNPLNGLLRTSGGKALYGQSSKSRQDAAHIREMHQCLASILRRISQPGLFERSCYLFDLGMQRAKYRWGRRARLCAGACVLIALNEQQKGETAATVAVSSSLIAHE
jgi:transcription factor IIIB subunit 2